MEYLQNWFGLLSPDIATTLLWSESLDKPLLSLTLHVAVKTL